MSDHLEEQEMEAEALTAIFDSAFEIISDTPPFKWSVKLLPIDCGGDEEEEEKVNHVAVKLMATIPELYPDEKADLDIEIIKGLAEPQRQTILEIANNEAESNLGMAAIFTICEAVREWLSENNEKGQEDESMYAQMMRKAKEAEKAKAQAEQKFEAQKTKDEMTEAELEEFRVRKLREEGTPCTAENFQIWLEKFQAEMEQKALEEKKALERESSSSKKKDKGSKNKDDDMENRLTGFEHFSGKAGVLNMDDIEAAVDKIAGDNLDVNEELFEDDDDLDDLDFDSDSDEEGDDDSDESDDEAPDI